jgi:hypothetical protein
MTPEAELVLAIAKDLVDGSRSFPTLQPEDLDPERREGEGDEGSQGIFRPFGLQNKKINWLIFKDILVYHGLTPFAYHSFKEYISFLPEDLSQTLKATYYYSLAHLGRLQRKFLELHLAFTERNVLLLPIKGVALLDDLYPDYPVRSSSDIDILVKEEDLEKAAKILEDLGYQKNLEGLKESYWRKKQYHFVFQKKEPNGFSPIVELHWGLDYPRFRRHLLPEMFNRLRKGILQNNQVQLLSVEDTFIALALHQRRFGIALSLRDVCDMATLLNKYASIFDWDYVLREARKAKIFSTIFFALTQVNLFFRITIPEYVWKGLNLPDWKKKIIRQFIKKNTFLSNQSMHTKNLYLKAHFLLYDNFWEPVDYILNIPKEQFAKYYGLQPYTKRTDFFYKNRLLYILFKAVLNLFSDRWK